MSTPDYPTTSVVTPRLNARRLPRHLGWTAGGVLCIAGLMAGALGVDAVGASERPNVVVHEVAAAKGLGLLNAKVSHLNRKAHTFTATGINESTYKTMHITVDYGALTVFGAGGAFATAAKLRNGVTITSVTGHVIGRALKASFIVFK